MARVKPVGQSYPPVEKIRSNPIVGRNKEKLLTHLALDLSSSCVGWAVGTAHDSKLRRHGKFVFKSTAGVGEKLAAFADFLPVLIDTFWPKVLLIEDIPRRKGSVTVRHAELLGIARLVWAQRTGGGELDPSWIIDPNTVKRVMGVKRGGDHDKNKIIMVNKINALYGTSFKFDKGSKAKSDDDIADAIAVLTTYWRRVLDDAA